MEYNEPLSAKEMLGAMFATVFIALVCAILVWTISHPGPSADAACIRSGYNRARQDLFSNDVYCVKDIFVKFEDRNEHE